MTTHILTNLIASGTWCCGLISLNNSFSWTVTTVSCLLCSAHPEFSGLDFLLALVYQQRSLRCVGSGGFIWDELLNNDVFIYFKSHRIFVLLILS